MVSILCFELIKKLDDSSMAMPKRRLGQALFLLRNRFLALVLPNLNRSG